jgi:hypothetical protein
MKRVLCCVVVGIMGAASSAHAALDWTGITVDTSDVDSAMGLIVPALIIMWGYRKVVKTVNRS